jgi:putative membrane protein
VLTARASAMALPLSLQGGAIGLVLVFRTNNAYARLEEARDMWRALVYLSREVVSKCVISLDYEVVCEVCRYLCALTWTLRDAVRSSKRRDDILSTLLPKEEVEWVLSQRSQPFAVLTRIRRILYDEFVKGKLPSHLHYVIEMDLAQIDSAIASCERLFSSPIPPNMARHGMRSLLLWLLALPVTLAGSVPPLLIVLWAASTSYIFLGIDELGAQVEQPFKIMPLWQVRAHFRASSTPPAPNASSECLSHALPVWWG